MVTQNYAIALSRQVDSSIFANAFIFKMIFSNSFASSPVADTEDSIQSDKESSVCIALNVGTTPPRRKRHLFYSKHRQHLG